MGVNETSYEILETGAGKFKLEIDGCPIASANVESIVIDNLTVDQAQVTTGADFEYERYAPGHAHYGQITISSRLGPDSKELYNWWKACSGGKEIRKNMSVISLKRDGSEARRWNLLSTFPRSWDTSEYSPASKVACETIVCSIGHVELG